MKELFEATFSLINIIPTILLLFVVAYWLLVIFGALDISSFDFDLDTDLEFDADADLEATGEVSVSWFNNVLSFFNIDKIPLMVFMTFWIIPVWLISIMTNHILGNSIFLFSLVLLVPNLIVSLFIAKPLTIPFIKLFKFLNKDEDASQVLLGALGKVIIGASDAKIGQGEVIIKGSNYRLNIKTKTGTVKKGEQILIVNYLSDLKYYIVEPYETID
jgi:hypothetical protein